MHVADWTYVRLAIKNQCAEDALYIVTKSNNGKK